MHVTRISAKNKTLVVFCTALLCLWIPVGHCQFEEAMSAYERQDYRDAAKLLYPLAKQGDVDAQYFLGRLYQSGKGLDESLVFAYRWFNLAAEGGHRHALSARERLTTRMSKQQVVRAKDRSRSWLERSPFELAAPPTKPPLVDPLGTTAVVSWPAERILALQRWLDDLGYKAGRADGVIGPQSEQAVREFQRDHGLPQDGLVSEDLLNRVAATWRVRTQEQGPPTKPERFWPRLVIDDAFADGDYQHDPRWEVMSGQFEVLVPSRLRSAVVRNRAKGSQVRTIELAPQRVDEVVRQRRFAALEDYFQLAGLDPIINGSRDGAKISTVERFDNGFYLRIDLSVPAADQWLSFGPYFDGPKGSGYRLAYHADLAPEFVLIRVGAKGVSVLAVGNRLLRLTNGRRRTIEWLRHHNGKMQVFVDRGRIMTALDRALAQPFDGFTWENRGGVYDLHSIHLRSRQ